MRNSNHVVADPRFLGGPLCTEAHYDESGACLALVAAPVLVHRGSRRGDLGAGVAHIPSLSPRASLSRIAISSGSRAYRREPKDTSWAAPSVVGRPGVSERGWAVIKM